MKVIHDGLQDISLGKIAVISAATGISTEMEGIGQVMQFGVAVFVVWVVFKMWREMRSFLDEQLETVTNSMEKITTANLETMRSIANEHKQAIATLGDKMDQSHSEIRQTIASLLERKD